MSSDPGKALIRAISESFANFGGACAIEELVSRSWASITFTGARHLLCLRVDGDGAEAAADAFLTDLDEREFDLCGHILADIALVSQESAEDGAIRLRLEALTVEAV